MVGWFVNLGSGFRVDLLYGLNFALLWLLVSSWKYKYRCFLPQMKLSFSYAWRNCFESFRGYLKSYRMGSYASCGLVCGLEVWRWALERKEGFYESDLMKQTAAAWLIVAWRKHCYCRQEDIHGHGPSLICLISSADINFNRHLCNMRT